MKKWLLGGLAFLALVLAGCQSQPPAEKPAEKPADMPAATAGKPERDPKVIEEIRATLAQHDKALGEKNLDAVMDTFINDPETVVLGTSNGERWLGPENIRNAYTEIFKDYDPNTLDTKCEWKTGQHLGDMAWLAATCQAKDSMKGKVRNYELNVTAAMLKQNGKWRFAMLHMSSVPASSAPGPSASGKP
jgi:uncharacterized protein (TIGR02246 family)